MALTRVVEQRLERVKLHQFFADQPGLWKELAQHAHDYVADNFPDGSAIRRDDVAGVLLPILAARKELTQHLNSHRLSQKHWVSDFCDLVVDRTWAEISVKKKPAT
jgi:hypothetical protein